MYYSFSVQLYYLVLYPSSWELLTMLSRCYTLVFMYLLSMWFNDYPVASTCIALANQDAHLLHGCEVASDSSDIY